VQPVSTEDKERVRALLRSFGALDKDMGYRGSGRAGYDQAPGGGGEAGTRRQPLALDAILDAGFWQYQSNFGEAWHQAATMMQPVGGMGAIGQAFGRELGDAITFDAEVRALRRHGDAARIVWRDARTGREHASEAALAVVTIPLPVLRGIPADFGTDTRAAVEAVEYVPAVKVGFQAERRFWELDAAIYGGISWTTRDITQVWYPSAGIQQRKGILVGAYIWSEDIGERFSVMPPAARIEAALVDGERLHPDYRRHLARGVTVAWKNVPFSGGAWAEWGRDTRAAHYPVLLRGDGPFLFAGEHVSYISGWQEGAVRSAHHVLGQIASRLG
jgi:monoamine oxidase